MPYWQYLSFKAQAPFLNLEEKSSLLLIIPQRRVRLRQSYVTNGWHEMFVWPRWPPVWQTRPCNEKNIRRIAKGRSLTGGHLIFSQAARQASRRVASHRVASHRIEIVARDLASYERRSKRRDLSAFNGPALVKRLYRDFVNDFVKVISTGARCQQLAQAAKLFRN